MKLIYFGTAPFAVPALERLAQHVVLVVSQPDRPSGRGMQLHPSPVKSKAIELGLPVATPEKCRQPEFVEQIRELHADALVVAAYGQILPTSLLDAARCGAINLHGSILPYYRGAAPIQRAIENGDTETGVTLMQMDKGMDTGDMIAIARTPIQPDETYGELAERLASIAADLAEEWMPRIVAESAQRNPQNNEEASYAPKVEKAEAELTFAMDAGEAYNRFRAFHPSPGPFIRTKLGMLKLSELRRSDAQGSPGTVMAVQPELVVSFVGGSLEFCNIQPEGKKRMSGRDWANGVRLKVGDNLMP